MEKLFRENKTSPLLKTPEKDFQSGLIDEVDHILSQNCLEKLSYLEKEIEVKIKITRKSLSYLQFIVL